MINPTTHAITEFPIPTGDAEPAGITAGPDGNLWFAGFLGPSGVSEIGMINPTTHAIAEFPVPTADTFIPDITSGPDGNLWFIESTSVPPGPEGGFGESGQIGMINPTTHAITEFPIPTGDAEPAGITAGRDGNLWFTEVRGYSTDVSQIGMINPTTHAITEFPTPTANPRLLGGITSGPDGDLWFTDQSGKIGQFALSPLVVGTVGVSQSRKQTSYTLTFDQPLNAASASNVRVYKVFEGVTTVVKKHKETVYTKALKIKRVVYNAGPDTVTILLAKPHRGPAQVRIAPGLEGTYGVTSSTTTLVVL
jgi:hypothetical protein